MGLPRNVRLNDELEQKVQDYLKINNIKFSQLIQLAIKEFINKPQTITLMPANSDEFLSSADDLYEEHKEAMDDLK